MTFIFCAFWYKKIKLYKLTHLCLLLEVAMRLKDEIYSVYFFFFFPLFFSANSFVFDVAVSGSPNGILMHPKIKTLIHLFSLSDAQSISHQTQIPRDPFNIKAFPFSLSLSRSCTLLYSLFDNAELILKL